MKRISHSYFVVMLEYPARYCDGVRLAPAGREAIVDPEVTRREVVSRIKSGEYEHISFIHFVDGLFIEDLTSELIDEAELQLKEEARERRTDRQAYAIDHAADYRKQEVV